MSDTRTVIDSSTPGDASTRRESVNGVARRENTDGATRRDTPGGGDAPTRREPPGRSRMTPAPRLNLPNSVDSQYEYVRDLPASGGEADIALIRDKITGDEVIFKYYKAGMAPDPMTMLMLRQADPEHVVRLIDFHDEADGTWELQEYCAPGSLRDWVAARGGRLDKKVLEAVLHETAGALKYLHGLGSGIAHRDLKPANVLVRSEEPLDLVLADFGLAKAQQAFTHLTTTVKGTWHYAAPEVHSKQSTAKSDWFSLGAMVYEFYTGRKLFAMADGTEVGEDDAKARCVAHNYTTELIDDPRWRLLADGLLTWDKDHRWGANEVEAWQRGESPEVKDAGVKTASSKMVGYRPSWSPTLVDTPQELANQFRQHWDAAASELAGRPDPKMTRFLQGFPGTEDAVQVIESTEAPGPKLVRLQALLDPEGPIYFEDTPLDDASISKRIQAADSGDDEALDWLVAMVKEHVLTAYAEVTGSGQAAQADYLLGTWNEQADAATRPLPPDYQVLARQAFRAAVPELFASALTQAGGAK